MELTVKPGKYVVAVSGGVDSMVLLTLLRQATELKLVVAHFDHGIRPDSRQDRELVQQTAERYGIPFEHTEGKLGPGTSEATARRARYEFLERVRHQRGADAIVTAHHQDDLLETAILNLLRGTGRKGLTSLANRPHVLRPLLGVSKAQLLDYARRHQVVWREDSTNADEAYLRNYVRRRLMPRLDPSSRAHLLSIVGAISITNNALDRELAGIVQAGTADGAFDRRLIGMLPYAVAKEVLAAWLRQRGIADFDRRTLERLVIATKTKPPGTKVDIKHTR